MQDTKRILQDDAEAVKAEIYHRESAARYDADCMKAEKLGWTDLSKVREQLSKAVNKLDQAKQALYFPAVKGYR